MTNTSTRTREFSDDHLEKLQKGAKRRGEEQLVGNYVRRVNFALFRQLLQEAVQPQSAAIERIIAQLSAADLLPAEVPPTSGARYEEKTLMFSPPRATSGEHRPELTTASSSSLSSQSAKEAAPEVRRPPPPMLDIL